MDNIFQLYVNKVPIIRCVILTYNYYLIYFYDGDGASNSNGGREREREIKSKYMSLIVKKPNLEEKEKNSREEQE